MDLSRSSVRCREALAIAQAIAVQRGHDIVSMEHLLLALLQQPNGLAPYLLAQSASGVEKLRCLIEMRLARVDPGVIKSTFIGAEVEALLMKAYREAELLHSSDVALGHVLIVLSEDPTQYGDFLRAHGVTRGRILFRGEVLDGIPSPAPEGGKVARPMLELYGRDLTRDAALGKLDPVVGRDEPVHRVLKLLLRRSKNNAILVGEPGVGKTAVVEAVAELIARGDVPEPLREKILVALDLGAMIAGTQYRGMFEERLKGVVREAAASKGKVILFIDEAHTLIGGGSAIGTPDAANLLKPALARGEIRLIAATTTEEYRRYFVQDQALERRFQPVFVDEPDLERTVEILRGLRPRYEAHHRVQIEDDALAAAASLSVRYVLDRRLPDKAIDLLDEAAAERRMECDRVPPELEALEERIVDLETRRNQQGKERQRDEPGSRDEIAELRTAAGWLRSRWQHQREQHEQVRALRSSLEALSREPQLDARKRAGLTGQLARAEEELRSASNDLIRETVTREDVAKVVSRWSGVPVTKLLEDEIRKLAALEDHLRASVVGQPEAAQIVAGAVLRARSGVKSAERPVGSFLFLGPSGVGKTSMAKALARHLFGDDNALVRIQMSDLSHAGAVTRLIGAPPGYVGFEDGGALTEAVRRRPYCIVLFDELEKAHRDVHNLLLQVLDEGRLSDARGRTVDFRNTLMILTSNLGSESTGAEIGFGTSRRKDDALEKHCSPELINRFDAVVEFHSLTPDNVLSIAELQTAALTERVAELGIRLVWSAEAKRWLAERGYDRTYGARPLRRLIEGSVEVALAKRLALSRGGRDVRVVVDPENEGLCLIEDRGAREFRDLAMTESAEPEVELFPVLESA